MCNKGKRCPSPKRRAPSLPNAPNRLLAVYLETFEISVIHLFTGRFLPAVTLVYPFTPCRSTKIAKDYFFDRIDGTKGRPQTQDTRRKKPAISDQQPNRHSFQRIKKGLTRTGFPRDSHLFPPCPSVPSLSRVEAGIHDQTNRLIQKCAQDS